MLRPMRIEEIGFGRVSRALTVSGQILPRGTKLSHEVLARMPAANRNAMIENRYIEVFPKGVAVREVGDTNVPDGAEAHVVPVGFGKYDVIVGNVVGAGLSREDADTLAKTFSPVVADEAVATALDATHTVSATVQVNAPEPEPDLSGMTPAERKSFRAKRRRADQRAAKAAVARPKEEPNGPIDG